MPTQQAVRDFQTKVNTFAKKINEFDNLSPTTAASLKDCFERQADTLDLSGEDLSTVPTEALNEIFQNLPQLTQLNLSQTGFKEVPTAIGKLAKLTVLDLCMNNLKTVPVEIGKLINLTILNLYRNQLESVPVGIGNLTNLTILNLYRNQLESVPAEIGNLTKLTALGLGNNKLKAVPEEIGKLTNLAMLILQENQLESVPAEIGKLTTLQVLNLSENLLSMANLPEALFELPPTCTIQLAQNRITNADLSGIHNGPRIVLNNDELRPLADTSNTLFQSITMLGIEGFNEHEWKAFESEAWAKSFSAWLTHLSGTADFQSTGTKVALQEQISEILRAIKDDPSLRAQLFLLAEQYTSSCHDNIALGLNEMSLAVLIRQFEKDSPSDKDLIDMGRRLYRLELVNQAAAKQIKEIKRTEPDFKEELGIHLVYSTKLREQLNLPISTKEMKYEATIKSKIATVNFKVLVSEIKNQSEDPEKFADFMAT